MATDQPRGMYSIRLAPDAVKHIDTLAEQEQRTRSAMIRVLLKEALAARAARKRP